MSVPQIRVTMEESVLTSKMISDVSVSQDTWERNVKLKKTSVFPIHAFKELHALTR